MRDKTQPAKQAGKTQAMAEFDPKAHAASMTRMRKEERERRERARRKHEEAIARRDAYRERGYRDKEAENNDTSPLDAVADVED